MLRTPIATAELSNMENMGYRQLVKIFESTLRTGARGTFYAKLPDAWGALFSEIYLSADELIVEMQRGEHRISEESERMLQEFIKADCAGGGAFVLDVIKKGGSIDRAALIMIADLQDLAGIERNGTTAMHMLAEASDRRIRPAFITRAGKKLLSQVFDKRGVPVLFSIYSLGDLGTTDLDAIAKVFSPGELGGVMSRNMTGKNALDVFREVTETLKRRPAQIRNAFSLTKAVKTTNMESGVRNQVERPAQNGGTAGTMLKGTSETTEGKETDSAQDKARYDALLPVDNIGQLMKKIR